MYLPPPEADVWGFDTFRVGLGDFAPDPLGARVKLLGSNREENMDDVCVRAEAVDAEWASDGGGTGAVEGGGGGGGAGAACGGLGAFDRGA